MGVYTRVKPFSLTASSMRSTIMDFSSKMALISGLRMSMNLWLRRVSISTLTLSMTPMGRGTAASPMTSAEVGMSSRPRAVWLLSLTSPVMVTTDSLGSLVSVSKSSGSIFFLGMVTWRVPCLSRRVRKEMPPRFLTSWTHPWTVAVPSETAMLLESLMTAMKPLMPEPYITEAIGGTFRRQQFDADTPDLYR